MSDSARGPEGSQSPLVEIRVLSVPKKGFLVVRFLADPIGIITHWGKRRPIACPGPDECPTSTHRTRQTWKGYAACEFWRDVPHEDWCPAVFEVTEHLYEKMQGRRVRGEVWKVWREVVKKDVTQVVGEMIDEVNRDRLRAPFKVEPAVWRVYQTKDILWGVEPYFPAPELVVPSAGARPKILEKPKRQEEEADKPILTIKGLLAQRQAKQEQHGESNGTHKEGNGCH